MLRLKYLFDNAELATMLIKNWQFDTPSLDLFKYYRISSNAIYPFKYNGKIHFLRFAPIAEKSITNLLAERDFVNFLDANHYPALKYRASLNGKDIETLRTPWGDYYASVFERVEGNSLEDIEFTGEIAKRYGQQLGSLHKLSAQYTPTTDQRWSYEDVLNWIEDELKPFKNEVLAKTEVRLLKEALAQLAKSSDTFGLIHYDYDIDNVFYEPQKEIMSVIDFDDAMYSWYAMDIEQALDSIENEVGGGSVAELQASFLRGYRQEFDVTDEMLSHIPLFRRFSNLYGYIRILRATAECWANEPQWMVQLRSKLNYLMTVQSKNFGQTL